MSVNNPKTDEASDFSSGDDSYKSGAGKIVETTDTAETFDRIGSAAAAEYNDRDTKSFDRNTSVLPADSSGDSINDDSPINRLIPLIIVFLLVILGYSFCSKPPEATGVRQNEFVTAKTNIV